MADRHEELRLVEEAELHVLAAVLEFRMQHLEGEAVAFGRFREVNLAHRARPERTDYRAVAKLGALRERLVSASAHTVPVRLAGLP